LAGKENYMHLRGQYRINTSFRRIECIWVLYRSFRSLIRHFEHGKDICLAPALQPAACDMADLLKALFDFLLLTAMDLLGQLRVMLLKPPLDLVSRRLACGGSLLLDCLDLLNLREMLALDNHSVTSLTSSHSPLRFSFHRVTLLSPPEIAKILPERDQLTLHNTASNSRVLLKIHELGSPGFVLVHILAVLSWLADAMYDFDNSVGLQATSRTQSLCPFGSTRVFT